MTKLTHGLVAAQTPGLQNRSWQTPQEFVQSCIIPVAMGGKILETQATLLGPAYILEFPYRNIGRVLVDGQHVTLCLPIDALIANYRADFLIKEITRYGELRSSYARPDRWTARDDLLLQRIAALRAAGFDVFNFWQKMKIAFKAPKHLTRMELLEAVNAAVGDDWDGISFTGGVKIWWGANTK